METLFHIGFLKVRFSSISITKCFIKNHLLKYYLSYEIKLRKCCYEKVSKHGFESLMELATFQRYVITIKAVNEDLYAYIDSNL